MGSRQTAWTRCAVREVFLSEGRQQRYEDAPPATEPHSFHTLLRREEGGVASEERAPVWPLNVSER